MRKILHETNQFKSTHVKYDEQGEAGATQLSTEEALFSLSYVSYFLFCF